MLSIIIVLILIGLLLWVVDQIPMDGTIKRIIKVVAIVCVVLWLLQLVLGAGGMFPYTNGGHGFQWR